MGRMSFRRPSPRVMPAHAPHPRPLDLHQGHEAVDLGFIGHQPGQDPAEAKGVLAQGRPDPVVAGRRRVALVEDEVDHLQDGYEAGLKIGALGDLERDMGLRERPLGAHDPLADRRIRDKEGSSDLTGAKPANEAQRQGDPRIHR